jgi:hypothetical protein
MGADSSILTTDIRLQSARPVLDIVARRVRALEDYDGK